MMLRCEIVFVLLSVLYYTDSQDDSPVLLVAVQYYINSMNLQTLEWTRAVVQGGNIISLDYDYDEQYIFWTDVKEGAIYKRRYTNSTKEAIVTNVNPEGLAVDWIYKHVYWTNREGSIEVSDYSGNMREVIVSEGIQNPRPIVVDPERGWMYWSEWGDHAKISRCGMNGDKREAIVTDGLQWPNGLTIDIDEQKLYWVDAKVDSIMSADVNGENQRLIYSGHHVAHPFSVTVYQDRVFWSDWQSRVVFSVLKENGTDVKPLTNYLVHRPCLVRVFHKSLQKNATSACGENNGGCSHLCLPTPLPDSEEIKQDRFSCACPDGFELQEGKICVNKNGTSEPDPAVLVAYRRFIDSVNLRTLERTRVVKEGTSIVFVDYDYEEQYIFWIDVQKSKIYKKRIAYDVDVIVSNVNPEGLAVDWINKHVYWTNREGSIEVSDYSGNMRKVIVSEGIQNPRTIVVDPERGWMYWNEWGKHAKIRRCGLNGERREDIITNGQIQYLTGLTLDLELQKLYWADAKFKRIMSADVNGENLTVVYNGQYVGNPFSVTVFQDRVFWSDFKNKSVFSVDKVTGKDVKRITFYKYSVPFQVRAYHKSLQMNATSACGENNGGCSHFCLPAPMSSSDEIRKSHDGYSCVCLDEWILQDARICVNETPSAASTTPVTVRSDIACNGDSISVFVPKNLLPAGQRVTWRDQDCSVSDNGTHYIGSVDFSGCGTTVQFTNDSVQFRNELISHNNNIGNISSVIDFGSSYDTVVPVECVYPKKANTMSSYLPIHERVQFKERRMGHLRLQMQQTADATFHDTLPQQQDGSPRKVPINQNIFIKLSSTAANRSDVGIRVDNCVATPTPSPADSTFQTLVDDGCPAIGAVTRYDSPSDEARFGVRAFQFSASPASLVYVHCQVSVCPTSDPQCITSCTPASRKRRSVQSDHESHLVSSGPYLLVAEQGSAQVATIVAAVCGLLAVVATTFAVIVWKKKRPTENSCST